MPRKPTTPYGHILFSKDRRVEKKVFQLSEEKTKQQSEVAQVFVEGFNGLASEQQIRSWHDLPENDNDCLLTLEGGLEVHLEITELVDRGFTFPMTREEYDEGKWFQAIQKDFGQLPWRIDVEKKEAALVELVEKKLAKHYAKESGKELWLLIFTTMRDYLTEYVEKGIICTSPALGRTRQYLAGIPSVDFDEIWFTNLETKPVRVWPENAA